MRLKLRLLLLLAVLSASNLAGLAQQVVPVSINTDLSIIRNFKKQQQFWAIGQNTQVQFHLKPGDAACFGFAYYTKGRFSNQLEATAKSPVTTPQQVSYTNTGLMRLKELSVGWRHYLKGSSEEEESFNLYGYAGFGLVLGKINNTHSVTIDTTVYSVPVKAGSSPFKRLTLDLGLGAEFSLGAQIYFYTEARCWIPTTDYPSPYLFVNKNAPLIGSANFGIRVFFD